MLVICYLQLMVDRLALRRITASEAREWVAAYCHTEPSRFADGIELPWGGWMVQWRETRYGPVTFFVCGSTGQVHTGSLARIAHLQEHGPGVPFSEPEAVRRSWWQRLLYGY